MIKRITNLFEELLDSDTKQAEIVLLWGFVVPILMVIVKLITTIFW